MSSVGSNLNWRIAYAVFCVIYAAGMVYLGLDNFDKVHSEYRWARERVKPAMVSKIALQELESQCRRKLQRGDGYRTSGDTTSEMSEDACRSFPAVVREEREKAVQSRLLAEKERFLRKLVVFYASFGIFFLVIPLVLLYLLLSFFIWIFKDLKISK
ncbi:MAG: hypothetical protein M8357_06925 [Desulfobulbaceae bacterium]|nr:hypothetical protein [Desulfobulbaceae bacterium]